MEFGLVMSTLLFFTGLDDAVAHARMPKPTPQIKKLMVDLGDDEWKVREDASRKLKELDYAALRAVLDGLKDKDLEVRHRCKRIKDSYFGIAWPNDKWVDATKIGPKGLVIKYKQDGKNLKYTVTRDQVVEMYKDIWFKLGRENSYTWHDAEVGEEISRRFVHKMRLWGVPREPIEKAMTALANEKPDLTDIVPQPMPQAMGGPRGAPAPNPAAPAPLPMPAPANAVIGAIGNVKAAIQQALKPKPAAKPVKPAKKD